MHIEAYEEMEKLLDQYCGNSVLDVGSLQVKARHKTFRELCQNRAEYTGTDINSGPNVDVVCNDHLPFPNAHFDTVITGNCFEHCEDPFRLIKECARVLKPGGYFIGIAPGAWPEHNNPDYWRILPDGWKRLFKISNLTPVDVYMNENEPGFADSVGVARK